MTADKGFKRLVRQRMRQTGHSYAAARQFLRRNQGTTTMPTPNELYETMDQLRETVKTVLAPIAAAANRPLEPALVSAVMFDRSEPEDSGKRHWTVWLYTLSPGYVIGRKGAVAADLLARLRDVADDPKLTLHIADFGDIHKSQQQALEERRRDRHDTDDT